jgi:hypothetical protein
VLTHKVIIQLSVKHSIISYIAKVQYKDTVFFHSFYISIKIFFRKDTLFKTPVQN